MKTAKLFEFCVSAPFIDLGDTNKAYIARKYGNLLGRSFQIIDDIIDQDQDEDNKNILNYMSKDDALLLCNQYKVRADKYLNKLFTKKVTNYLRYLAILLNKRISDAGRCSYRSICGHWFRDS